ncbi:12558_t:CDS:10, partial [Entrophospora sp. SA101]
MTDYQVNDEDPEEVGLISKNAKRNKKNTFLVFSTILVILFIVIGFGATLSSFTGNNVKNEKRNVILMISDGFGPASETFARSYYQYINHVPYKQVTPLDEILIGTSRTRSFDSLVTDSAAGATAFSCAIKTYNNAIAVDSEKNPCGTVLESAKHNGMVTGLVVTSRITHATPAAFSAHIVHRDLESEIAVHQIGDYPLGRQVDLMFGGGKCFFLPNSSASSCRTDDRDVLSDAINKFGFNYLSTRKEFDDLKLSKKALPLLGLFNLDHISYEIDRDPSKEPSLKEMTEKAIKILEDATADSDKGFFLMVEGSKIDLAAHSNDPATHAHEIFAYHDTISLVKQYVSDHPGTVMISVSDHETGGLSLALQTTHEYPEYGWYPEVLTKVKNSSFVLSEEIEKYSKADRKDYIKKLLENSLGIIDYTQEDIEYLNQNQLQLDYELYLSNMTSHRAELGWATHGHSGVDVNLYAYGDNIDYLYGNHENTDIGEFIINYLGLDLNEYLDEIEINNGLNTDKRKNLYNIFIEYLNNLNREHAQQILWKSPSKSSPLCRLPNSSTCIINQLVLSDTYDDDEMDIFINDLNAAFLADN